MKAIYILFLILLPVLSFGQRQLITYSCSDRFCSLFFNLELDSSKTSLEKQIKEIPKFRFLSTDRVDTLWRTAGTEKYYWLIPNPRIPGMPCFYSAHNSEDRFQPDSLKIFLGGGGGVTLAIHSEQSISYTIETVEIIREFTDSLKARETYEALNSELEELCLLDPMFVFVYESENGNISSGFSLEDIPSDHITFKRVELNFNKPCSAESSYVVRLSYSKEIDGPDYTKINPELEKFAIF